MSAKKWYGKKKQAETQYGPFDSKLDAFIACFPQVLLWEEAIGAESIPETALYDMEALYMNSGNFPCNIPPKSAVMDTT